MKAKCRKCGDIVEVTRPREYKSCKCGAIALDYGDGENYYRAVGNPENFDGEIEDAPEPKERGKSVKIAEQAREYLQRAVEVKESFRNVNVDLCEDGTLWIDDAKTDEQLAKFIIR